MSEVDKILKNPVMQEQTDTERKIKNNLISFSVISIFMYFGEVSISEDSTFLGLKFLGLNQDKIYIGLFMMVLYSLIHYLWIISDSLRNWVLRKTAVSENIPGTWGSPNSIPQIEDKRNNTIYAWWAWKSGKLNEASIVCDSLVDIIKALKEKYLTEENKKDSKTGEPSDLASSLILASSECTDLSTNIKKTIDAFNSSPINESLENFNHSFRGFLISQNTRWLVFDCLIPLALAFISMACLLLDIVHLIPWLN